MKLCILNFANLCENSFRIQHGLWYLSAMQCKTIWKQTNGCSALQWEVFTLTIFHSIYLANYANLNSCWNRVELINKKYLKWKLLFAAQELSFWSAESFQQCLYLFLLGVEAFWVLVWGSSLPQSWSVWPRVKPGESGKGCKKNAAWPWWLK